ncbi:hypothetical protein WJX74_005211 [Apatococcus lobatus]|uniref:Fido domain-containing protein n=1 Tax=Apatococcus lobatus TaxID=904363 RepID=A0AAW1SFP2_9CHLO
MLADIQMASESFCMDAAARFVLSANLSEETGLNDLESTRLALRYYERHLDAARREGLHSPEALSLTPDMLLELHQALMYGSKHVGGQLRAGQAQAGQPGTSKLHIYPGPDGLEDMLLAVCDRFNQALGSISPKQAESIPQLYRLAAVLFVEFVTVHPFSDGNGRLGRILASHVLRGVTPFPVTPFADGTVATRSVFIKAITAGRGEKQRNFLQLGAPCDFAALLIEAGWDSWQQYQCAVNRAVQVPRSPSTSLINCEVSFSPVVRMVHDSMCATGFTS